MTSKILGQNPTSRLIFHYAVNRNNIIITCCTLQGTIVDASPRQITDQGIKLVLAPMTTILTNSYHDQNLENPHSMNRAMDT